MYGLSNLSFTITCKPLFQKSVAIAGHLILYKKNLAAFCI